MRTRPVTSRILRVALLAVISVAASPPRSPAEVQPAAVPPRLPGPGAIAAEAPFLRPAEPPDSAAAPAEGPGAARGAPPGPGTTQSVRTGRLAGAIVGGVAGGGFGILIALFGQGLCEGDCPDGDFGYYASWTGGGLLLGAATGYLVGSFLGGLVPPPEPANAPRGGRRPRGAPRGSLGVELFGGRYTDRPGSAGALGGRISLLRHQGPGFAYGAEVGTLGVDPRITSYGLVLRLAPPRTGFRPHGVVGLCVQRYGAESTLLGGSIGGGAERVGAHGANALRLEARYCWNLQNSEYEATPRFRVVTVGLGYRFGW